VVPVRRHAPAAGRPGVALGGYVDDEVIRSLAAQTLAGREKAGEIVIPVADFSEWKPVRPGGTAAGAHRDCQVTGSIQMLRYWTLLPWSWSRMAPVDGPSAMLPPVPRGISRLLWTVRPFQTTVIRAFSVLAPSLP
jgi:hypothetical protein